MSGVAGTPAIDSPKASVMTTSSARVARTITACSPQSLIRAVTTSRTSSPIASREDASAERDGEGAEIRPTSKLHPDISITPMRTIADAVVRRVGVRMF
jgi:hypothetical protein